MTEDEKIVYFDTESSAIQTHLSIIQSIIQRMAANSSSCKTWCITLVSAMLVIIVDKDKHSYIWIALLPTFLFTILDAYYLALEKGFRNSYNHFISKLYRKTISDEDLYSVIPQGNIFSLLIEAFKSFSIWGFYLPMTMLVALSRFLII